MARNNRNNSLLASIGKRLNNIAAVIGYAFIIKSLVIGDLIKDLRYLAQIVKDAFVILISGT